MGQDDADPEERHQPEACSSGGSWRGPREEQERDEEVGDLLAHQERHVHAEGRERDRHDGRDQRQASRQEPAREEVGEGRQRREGDLEQDLEDQRSRQAGGLGQHRRQQVDAQAGVVGVLQGTHRPALGIVGQGVDEVLRLDVVPGHGPATQRRRQQQSARDHRQHPDVTRRRRGASEQQHDQCRSSHHLGQDRDDSRRVVVQADGSEHGEQEPDRGQGLRRLDAGAQQVAPAGGATGPPGAEIQVPVPAPGEEGEVDDPRDHGQHDRLEGTVHTHQRQQGVHGQSADDQAPEHDPAGIGETGQRDVAQQVGALEDHEGGQHDEEAQREHGPQDGHVDVQRHDERRDEHERSRQADVRVHRPRTTSPRRALPQQAVPPRGRGSA